MKKIIIIFICYITLLIFGCDNFNNCWEEPEFLPDGGYVITKDTTEKELLSLGFTKTSCEDINHDFTK